MNKKVILVFKYVTNDIQLNIKRSSMIFLSIFFLFIVSLSSNKISNGIKDYLIKELKDPRLNNVKLVSSDSLDGFATEKQVDELLSLKWYFCKETFNLFNSQNKEVTFEQGRYAFIEKFIENNNLSTICSKLDGTPTKGAVPTHFSDLQQVKQNNRLERISFYTTNKNDPMLEKISFIDKNKTISIKSLLINKTNGIVLTEEKYNNLEHKNNNLDNIIFIGGDNIYKIDIVGVVKELPFNKEAIIFEDFYKNLYLSGANDRIPDFQFIIFYFDKIEDIVDISKSIQVIGLEVYDTSRLEGIKSFQMIINTIKIFNIFILGLIVLIAFPFIALIFNQVILFKIKQIAWMLCYNTSQFIIIMFFVVEGAILLLFSYLISLIFYFWYLSSKIDEYLTPLLHLNKESLIYFKSDYIFFFELPIIVFFILTLSILLGSALSIYKLKLSKVLRGI